jgi:hypothetical protein
MSSEKQEQNLLQMTSPDLADEISAINSIYAPTTLTPSTSSLSSSDSRAISLILTLPTTPLSFLLHFPTTYPAQSPQIDRVIHTGPSLPRGFGNAILELAKNTLDEVSSEIPNTPVVFELIERVEATIVEQNLMQRGIDGVQSDTSTKANTSLQSDETHLQPDSSLESKSEREKDIKPPPIWVLGTPQTSHKSTFHARACSISTADDVPHALHHLLSTDKKCAKATHNMWAYRVKSKPLSHSSRSNEVEIVYADSSDDGEDGAGAKLASLIQVMGAWNVLLVVS